MVCDANTQNLSNIADYNTAPRRNHRRVMHQAFHPAAALRYRPLELKATYRLLRGMLEEPDNLFGNLRQYASC